MRDRSLQGPMMWVVNTTATRGQFCAVHALTVDGYALCGARLYDVHKLARENDASLCPKCDRLVAERVILDPNSCVICKKPNERPNDLCDACWTDVRDYYKYSTATNRAGEPICGKCGAPRQPGRMFCSDACVQTYLYERMIRADSRAQEAARARIEAQEGPS